jgi:hypothetical protein
VPVRDAKQLEMAMRTLLVDEAARQRAVETGLKRGESYRWDRFAAETFACYEELCRKDGTSV